MSGINTLLKEFYINSSAPHRDPGGTNEDFYITESGRHYGPPLTPKRVKLARATIPFTWFNVTNSNNVFELIDVDGTHQVTMPPGNYDAPTLAAVIGNLLNALPGLAGMYTVAFNTMTFRLIFSSVDGVRTFQLNFDIPNSAALLLGFPVGSTTESGTNLTAPNMVGLVPDFEIFICSDLVQGCDNGLVMWNTSPPSNTQILAKVSVSGCYGSILNYCGCECSPFFDMRGSPYAAAATSTIVPEPPRRMHFWLQFPSGMPVDLNGAHWTATLVVDFGSEINI